MPLSTEIEQEQVVVRPAGDDAVTARLQHAHHRARVVEHLALIAANSGCSASRNATALAAITCINGPPCVPGKIIELSFLVTSSLARARISPPRGPRSVLCVVVVTTSAIGTGLG